MAKRSKLDADAIIRICKAVLDCPRRPDGMCTGHCRNPLFYERVIELLEENRWATILDARAKRVLNISGAEFVTRWKAGEFKNIDSGDCPGVIELALLAPNRAKKS